MKHTSNLILLAALFSASSLEAKWSRIPILKERPVNVAVQGPHSSASIDSSSGIGQVDNLLSQDDVTAASTIGAGKAFFIINFGKPLMVSSSSMTSDGIEGKISLSASADKTGWAVLEEKVVSAADRTIDFKFAGIQAKFLKYEFALSKGGSIRAHSVLGGQTDRGYALKQDPKGEKGKPMNFIGGLGGARLVYAAPQPSNGLDSAAAFNRFEFPESDEQYRTLIYDMGQLRIMNEFSSTHSPSPVRFEVFVFDQLPEKEDWRGRLTFDPSDFSVASPVVAVEDPIGNGFIKAKPSKPVKTRYLAMRWEPDFNPPAFTISGVSGAGRVETIQGAQTRTVNFANGQTMQITIDPGDAHGAGTDAGNGTVTVQPVDAAGQPSGPPQVFNATDVTITPTGVQVQSQPAGGGAPVTVAQTQVNTDGTITVAPVAGGETPTSPTNTTTSTDTNSGNLGSGDSPAATGNGGTSNNQSQIVTGVTSP